MSEKVLARLVAAVVITPLCAVCALGPAVIVSLFTATAAWPAGFDGIVAAGFVLAAGVAVFAIVRKRRAQRAPVKPAGEMSQ